MSFKVIDLQFATHKNDEAGIRQNQLMQKPKQDEAVLEHQAAQTTERSRQRSSKIEETDAAAIKDGGKQNQQRESSGKKKAKRGQAEADKEVSHPNHPYKGHHIDLLL